MIEEEIGDAKKYAKCAIKYKDTDAVLAKCFFDLSTAEMRHMEMLHAEVARIITQYRKENGEPPTTMMAVYDYLHEKQIEESKEVKDYQAMYRG